MNHRAYLACIVVAALTGCSNRDAVPKPQEPEVPVRQSEAEVLTQDKDLNLEVGLSANTVAVGGNLSITVKLANVGKTDVTLNRNDLSAWLSVTDSDQAPITELPFMDRIGASGAASPLLIPGGESVAIRVFGAQVTEGRWEGFGTSGKHKGVGLVVQRDAGSSCYPLATVPGTYFISVHLKSLGSGVDVGSALNLESKEVALLVTESGPASAHSPPRPAYEVSPVRGHDQTKSDGRDVVAFAGEGAKEGLVESINAIRLNYPDSEKLSWVAAKDVDAVDPRWIALGRAKEGSATAGKHTVVVDRYATIGEHILLCGHYEPPFPDGSFNWVINWKDMKYVGHFFDKDSR